MYAVSLLCIVNGHVGSYPLSWLMRIPPCLPEIFNELGRRSSARALLSVRVWARFQSNYAEVNEARVPPLSLLPRPAIEGSLCYTLFLINDQHGAQWESWKLDFFAINQINYLEENKYLRKFFFFITAFVLFRIFSWSGSHFFINSRLFRDFQIYSSIASQLFELRLIAGLNYNCQNSSDLDTRCCRVALVSFEIKNVFNTISYT